jgi:cytoskeletal protein CcmA (bactofilin family)
MFSSPKEKAHAAVALPVDAKRVAAPAPAMPSIISSNLTIKGTLYTPGELQVDGRVDGDVGAGVLVIGEKAIIQGDVLAADATVRGHVKGDIRARKLTLCATCHVEGSILYQSLAIETGAFYEGDCRPSKDPLVPADQQQAQQAQPQPAQQPVQPPRPVTAAAPPVRPQAPATAPILQRPLAPSERAANGALPPRVVVAAE